MIDWQKKIWGPSMAAGIYFLAAAVAMPFFFVFLLFFVLACGLIWQLKMTDNVKIIAISAVMLGMFLVAGSAKIEEYALHIVGIATICMIWWIYSYFRKAGTIK